MNEIVTEATVIDGTHLVLKHALPEDWGQRILVCVMPIPVEPGHLLHELKKAYLTMSEQEHQAEVALAEEGLQTQPDMVDAFPGEAKWPWWE
jgi:hypothetical protein